MYCSNCGTENQEGARFCNKCGAELKGVSNVAAQNNNEIKVDRDSINKIGQLAAELQQLDNVEKALSKKQKELAYVNESIDRNNKNISNNRDLILIMGGISLGIVFGLCIILYIVYGMFSLKALLLLTSIIVASVINITIYPTLKGSADNRNLILVIGGVYLGTVLVLYVICYLICNVFSFSPGMFVLLISIFVAAAVDKKLYPKIKSSVQKRLAEQGKKLEEKQAKTRTECEQMGNDRQQLINSLSNNIGIIPPKYRTLMAVQFIYESLSNMRAETMKEAINLYEEQLHRWKMEASQQRMEELARQQVTAAHISAAANVVSASANIANASHTKDIANHTRNIANRITGGY